MSDIVQSKNILRLPVLGTNLDIRLLDEYQYPAKNDLRSRHYESPSLGTRGG